MKKYVIYAFCVLILGNAVSLTIHPGLELELSVNALRYAFSVAVDQVGLKVKGLTIPDQHKKAKPFITGYDITGMRITKFVRPMTSLTIKPGTGKFSGVMLLMSGLGVSLTGKWHVFCKDRHLLDEHGTFTIDVSGAKIIGLVKIGSDVRGHVTLSPTMCEAFLNSVRVQLQGGKQVVRHGIATKIKKRVLMLRTKICPAVYEAIQNADKIMRNFSMSTVLAGMVDFDYRMTSAPVLQTNAIKTWHKGEFFWKTKITEAPFQPEVMPNATGTHRMVTLYLSDYVINTLGYSLFTYGPNFPRYDFTKQDLPAEYEHFLKTASIPSLYIKYPNGWIEVDIRATRSLQFSTASSVVHCRFQGQLDFKVRLPSDDLVEGFIMNLDVSISVGINVKGSHMTPRILDISFEESINKSAVGPIPETMFHIFFRGMVDVITSKLNVILGRGFDLPKIKNLQFVSPELTIRKGYVIFSTDLKYTAEQTLMLIYKMTSDGFSRL